MIKTELARSAEVARVPRGGRSLLVNLTPHNARIRRRLCLFPWSGATPRVFRDWAEVMPSDVQLTAVQLPGRAGRMGEVPSECLESVADEISDALVEDPCDGFALMGHSYGGLLAHAVALRLQDRGHVPDAVVVSGTRPPVVPPHVVMHELDDERLLRKVRRMGGMSPRLVQDREFLERFLPVLRADFTACETHVVEQPQPLRCRLSVWAGARDWYAPPRVMTRWQGFSSTHATKIRVFPGDHFFLRDRRFAELVLGDVGWRTARQSDPPALADRAGVR